MGYLSSVNDISNRMGIRSQDSYTFWTTKNEVVYTFVEFVGINQSSEMPDDPTDV